MDCVQYNLERLLSVLILGSLLVVIYVYSRSLVATTGDIVTFGRKCAPLSLASISDDK